MKAPQRACLKCGKTHWGNCPEQAVLGFPIVVDLTMPPDQIEVRGKNAVRIVNLAPADPPRTPFDRNAYQREYMRKRRAKKP